MSKKSTSGFNSSTSGPASSVLEASAMISMVGKFYANNIQMVKYVSPAHLMNTKDFAVLPISNNLRLIKNTYRNQKNVTNLFSKNSSVLLNMSTNFNYPQSYISVLNNYQLHFGKFK